MSLVFLEGKQAGLMVDREASYLLMCAVHMMDAVACRKKDVSEVRGCGGGPCFCDLEGVKLVMGSVMSSA